MHMRLFCLFILVFSSAGFTNEQDGKIYKISPDEIKKFKRKFSNVERAIYNEPEPSLVSRSLPVSLLPGDKIQRLCLVPGFVSTLTIVDSTGEPWPIKQKSNPNEPAFKVTRPKGGELNLLNISALSNSRTANIAVTVQGEDTPIHILLTSRKKECKEKNKVNKNIRLMDVSRTLLVQKAGPRAKPIRVGKSIGAATDDVIYSVLNQTPPDDAISLGFNDHKQSIFLIGWEIQNNYYILSSEDLTWPAFSQVSMQGELTAYRIAPVDMLMISVDGKPISIGVNRSTYVISKREF